MLGTEDTHTLLNIDIGVFGGPSRGEPQAYCHACLSLFSPQSRFQHALDSYRVSCPEIARATCHRECTVAAYVHVCVCTRMRVCVCVFVVSAGSDLSSSLGSVNASPK